MKRLISYLKVKLNEERMYEQKYLDEGSDGIALLFTSNIKMLEESISILNGEIRESCKKLCPDCGHPYISYLPEEHYECNSCGHTWT